jgi:hypothetical protein
MAKSGASQALAVLNVLPGLALMLFVCAGVVSFVAELPASDPRVIAWAIAIALPSYAVSQVFEHFFGRWYRLDEQAGTLLERGRTPLDLLPVGRDLHTARLTAMKLLPGRDAHYHGEGIYSRSAELVRRRASARWAYIFSWSAVDKACRGLIVVTLLLVAAAVVGLVWPTAFSIGTRFPAATLGAFVPLGIFIAVGFFLAFVWCKWQHMLLLYEAVATIEGKPRTTALGGTEKQRSQRHRSTRKG